MWTLGILGSQIRQVSDMKVQLIEALILKGVEADFTVGNIYDVKHITDSMNRGNFIEYLMDDKGHKKFFGFTNPIGKEDREVNKHFLIIKE